MGKLVCPCAPYPGMGKLALAHATRKVGHDCALATLAMLDFSKIKTPAEHGEVLVVPEAGVLASIARANNTALRSAHVPLLDATLAACRRKTREAVVGCDDKPVIVTGHGPEFIHPGVWAKHIVAMRLASAVDGVALNLVVDSDAPKGTVLPIPSVSQHGVVLRSVPFARLPSGYAYEHIPRQSTDEVNELQRAVREAMGDRYDRSQMPAYFAAFSRSDAGDWVDQALAGRRAVESHFGVAIDDRRVSRVWYSPLLLDMLTHAQAFAASYNRALERYRRNYRVRGVQRPIPDLECGKQRCEVAVWVYRADEPRRRLFVARTGDDLRLFAGHTQIGALPLRRLDSCSDMETVIGALSDWRLRPRALTLTIWARLLLADLFIHGIGGAKYDRIADAIIAEYYGIRPPEMACVSATLHMDLPRSGATPESVRRLRYALRDLQHNPQRNLPPGEDIDPLIEKRAELVRRSIDLAKNDPRNRPARRANFEAIKEVNQALLAKRPEAIVAPRNELGRLVGELHRNRIAGGREYFFGLYDRNRLEQLLDALPQGRDFRV